jgi:hypothetical protein
MPYSNMGGGDRSRGTPPPAKITSSQRAKAININRPSVRIYPLAKISVEYKVKPDNAADKEFTAVPRDAGVATAEINAEAGTIDITAVSVGSTWIDLVYTKDPKVNNKILVTVIPAPPPPPPPPPPPLPPDDR